MEKSFISVCTAKDWHQSVKKLPGNWRAVIMEKVDGEEIAKKDMEAFRQFRLH